MRDRGLGLVLVGIVGLGVGCHGSKYGPNGSPSTAANGTTSGSTSSRGSNNKKGGSNTPATPAPPAGTPTVASATFADVDGNGAVSAGDTLTVTFSKEVVLGPATDPNAEFALPVKNDTFGQGATMAAGAQLTDVVITLGTAPKLRVSGTFNATYVGAGDASGVDVSATTQIADANGTKAAAYKPADVDGPFQEAWTVAANMQVARAGHTATLLPDGRILIVGGFTIYPAQGSQAAGPGLCQQSEVYDPVANTFTLTSQLNQQAGDMTVPVNMPANNAFGVPAGPTALPVARMNHTATLLKDGTVLIAGGYGFESVDAQGNPVQADLASAHIFDPKTNAFTLVAAPGAQQASTLTIPRSHHTATLMDDGKVLIAGGFNNALPVQTQSGQQAVQPTTLPAVEIYDPAAMTFAMLPNSTGNDMTAPRRDFVAGLDGATKNVVMSGGVIYAIPQQQSGSTGTTGGQTPQAQPVALSGGAETFDETAGKCAATTSKPSGDYFGQAGVVDGSGTLFIAGGQEAKGLVAAVDAFNNGAFTKCGFLKTARMDAAIANLDGIIVVGGGLGGSGQSVAELASVEVVNADSKQVEPAPAMANARDGATFTAVNGKLIAIGGSNGASSSSPGNVVAAAEIYSRP